MKVILFFNIFYFLSLNGTTSFLALMFFVALMVISGNVMKNYYTFSQYFHGHSCPKNLTVSKSFKSSFSITNFLSNLAMDLSSLLISIVEMCGQWVRPISLTCRLSSNISSSHLLMSMCTSSSYFAVSSIQASFFMWFLFMPSYLMFEIGVAIIQSYVYSFLIGDYNKECKS